MHSNKITEQIKVCRNQKNYTELQKKMKFQLQTEFSYMCRKPDPSDILKFQPSSVVFDLKYVSSVQFTSAALYRANELVKKGKGCQSV